MKNEKDLSKRDGTATRKRKAAEAAPSVGRMGIGTRQAQRRKGDRPQHAKPRTAGDFTDGFLRQQFMPMYAPSAGMPENKEVDKGVLNSLANVAEKFRFIPAQVQDLPYPYNVLLAHEATKKQLSRKSPDLELFIMETDAGGFSLATMETVNRSYDLYYIPVRPLFRLLRSEKSRLAGKLLLAVFSYLYHVAKVPGHRDEETFLYYHTQMIADWLDDDSDWEEEDTAGLQANIRQAAYEGDYVQKRYGHAYHLAHFAETVASAKPVTHLETQCLKIAGACLKLWQDYPQGDIFQHLHLPDGREEQDDDYYDNTIYVQEYVHFIHDVNDALYNNMYGNVQTEFNEKPYAQQHSLITLYDQPPGLATDTLNYPKRFFQLTDQLCDLLINDIP